MNIRCEQYYKARFNLSQLQLELTATVGGGTGELVGPGVGTGVGPGVVGTSVGCKRK